jgi:3-dehydroquinate synthase
VTISVAVDSGYSHRLALLAKSDYDKSLWCLTRGGFELWHDAMEGDTGNGPSKIFEGLDALDHVEGELHRTLLHGSGRSLEVHGVLRQSLKYGIRG